MASLYSHIRNLTEDQKTRFREAKSGGADDASAFQAALGPAKRAPKKTTGPRFYLTRIPLDRQGYTKGKYPRYYGVGAPLFRLEDENGDQVSGFASEFRAADRDAAIRMIRAKHPTAKFR